MKELDSLASRHGIAAIYLHGSQARRPQPGSDFDIAVLLVERRDWDEELALCERLADVLARQFKTRSDRLDVRILNDAPPDFQYRVIRDRKLLYEADRSHRVAFERNLLLEYLDFPTFSSTRSSIGRPGAGGWRRAPLVVDRNFVERLLAELEGYLVLLEEASREENLESDRLRFFGVLYGLQCAIEAMIAIGHHLIAECNLPTPQRNVEVMQILAREGVVRDSRLADQLPRMVRFRNLLVHRYWQVDPLVVQRILRLGRRQRGGRTWRTFGGLAARSRLSSPVTLRPPLTDQECGFGPPPRSCPATSAPRSGDVMACERDRLLPAGSCPREPACRGLLPCDCSSQACLSG